MGISGEGRGSVDSPGQSHPIFPGIYLGYYHFLVLWTSNPPADMSSTSYIANHETPRHLHRYSKAGWSVKNCKRQFLAYGSYWKGTEAMVEPAVLGPWHPCSPCSRFVSFRDCMKSYLSNCTLKVPEAWEMAHLPGISGMGGRVPSKKAR